MALQPSVRRLLLDPMTTLVLLPGMDGTADLFGPLVAALGNAVNARLVRYPPSAQRYTEVEAVIRQALPRDEPFILLAESFSGPAAISIAASGWPGLTGLVLCCTFACCPLPYVSRFSPLASWLPFELLPQAAARLLLLGRFATPQLRQALAETLARVPAGTLRGRLRAVLEIDCSPSLRKVAVPVLYLQGLRDRLVPPSAAGHIRSVLPRVQVVPLEGPHFLLQVLPDECAAAVTRFAATLANHAAEQDQVQPYPSTAA